ncbi:nuclear transport factor 2 family protein [Ferirhizobium litorale]|uniref:Nuclear transport factor 2 family protein n=1 Tax=Ferirhizobium litorale TaxID=2927786 RepID=A0AAE3QKW7_9HYPH|nr:nuclear transport factor 2 family protein [Fererhizobium litorale]MDI7925206.1 nuclear transport factor 2 family protein [Fererhizobium litorale]
MQDELVLINTIRGQKARYCRFVDTKEWASLAELIADRPQLRFFAPDGTLLYEFDSAAEWIGLMRNYLDGSHTIHQVHNDEIEVVSDTEVKAIWSMEDYLLLAEGSDRPASIHGFGHYYETWRLMDAKWRLTDLELRRTILEIKPRQ